LVPAKLVGDGENDEAGLKEEETGQQSVEDRLEYLSP